MTRRLAPWFFLLPALAVFALYTVAPFASLLRLTLFESNYIVEQWVGLANFGRLFADSRFWRTIGATAAFALAIAPAQTMGGLLVALLVIDASKRVQDVTRFLFYAPLFASGVIISQVWAWIYHPQAGLANWILGLIGVEPVYWFNGRATAIGAIAMMIVSSSIGGGVVLFLATMLGIPGELYESARIDGASPRQIRWRLVAPMIAPTVSFVALLNVVGTLGIWQPVFVLTNGGPDHGTETLMYSIYLDGFIFGDFGLAACKTLVLVALAVGLTVAGRKVAKLA